MTWGKQEPPEAGETPDPTATDSSDLAPVVVDSDEITAPSAPPLIIPTRPPDAELDYLESGARTLRGVAPGRPAPVDEPPVDEALDDDSDFDLFGKEPPEDAPTPTVAPQSLDVAPTGEPPPGATGEDWLERLGTAAPPPSAPVRRDEPTMTRFARAAMDFADYFDAMVGDIRVVGSCPRKPTLRTPDGRTTSGGVQSVQHVVLEPESPGHPSYTAGWINTANHTALIRTHTCLETMHRRRFGATSFGVDAAAYRRLVQSLRALCEEQGFHLRLESNAPPRPPRVSNSEVTRVERSHTAWLVIGVLLLLGMTGLATIIAYQYLF